MSLLDPLDPRVLELTPDWLFFGSLQPNPLMSGFTGTVAPDGAIRATIAWPNLPGLAGILLHAGGWTVGSGRPIGELLQSVELVIP